MRADEHSTYLLRHLHSGSSQRSLEVFVRHHAAATWIRRVEHILHAVVVGEQLPAQTGPGFARVAMLGRNGAHQRVCRTARQGSAASRTLKQGSTVCGARPRCDTPCATEYRT